MTRSTLLLIALLLPLACRHGETPPPERPKPTPAPSAAAAPDWWRGEVFYEVFVRSFADSDGDGEGDLPGLTARLDYLNDGDPATSDDLGVDALWLMPIYPSPSYHGYDVTDYQAIQPAYGTLEDFDAFVTAAHARGVRVILDFVLNHSSSEHPWFRAARASADDPHRAFYTWRDEPDPTWTRPWDGAPVWHPSGDESFYALFWSGMPDVNLAHPPARDAMVAAMRFWLDRGVDGFRIDAARYLVEEPGEPPVLADSDRSHRLIREIRAELEADHPDVLLVAEAWTDTETIATYRGDGDEYQLAFSFGTQSALLESLRDRSRAHLAQELTLEARTYDDRGFAAPFLTNHDMRRVMRVLDDDADKARLAAAVLLALPGSPFLYYGEELGMRGGDEARDEAKRTPMRWTEQGAFTTGEPWLASEEPVGVSVAAQTGAPDSLLSWYRRIIAARRASPALALGDARIPAQEGGGRGAFALLREHDDERVLVLANFHDDEPTAAWTVDVRGEPELLLSHGLEGRLRRVGGRLLLPALAPGGFAHIRLGPAR